MAGFLGRDGRFDRMMLVGSVLVMGSSLLSQCSDGTYVAALRGIETTTTAAGVYSPIEGAGTFLYRGRRHVADGNGAWIRTCVDATCRDGSD